MDQAVNASRISRLIETLTRLKSADPQAHLTAITETNPTANKPYHNAQHGITVALYASEGAEWFGFATIDKLAITLAALYHDYNHTSPDDNISRPLAIVGAQEHITRIEGERRTDFIRDIGTMIEESRYAKRRKAPEYYPSRFVYDADHMQVLEPDFDEFLIGLGEETGRKLQRDAYIADLRKRKLFTRWGKEYALVRVLQPDRFGLTP
jgi:hypothetical protein